MLKELDEIKHTLELIKNLVENDLYSKEETVKALQKVIDKI